ncbi:MAG: flavodoxin family protein [bacterium]|nr:flavodoxin family protein [bacterium]
MKIVLISASPRKNNSQTFALAQEVIKGCNPEQLETIHLCDYKIEFCRHCERCHRKIMDCPIKDDVLKIMKKMLAADGIILASPNYIDCVTASMKALFDRSTHFIHCKRLLGKYIAGVVSSGAGYDEPVVNYIKHYALTCGAQFAGSISSRAPVDEKTKEKARVFGEKLHSIIKNKKTFKNQLKIIEQGKAEFKDLIILRKDSWRGEYEYWKKQNWI